MTTRTWHNTLAWATLIVVSALVAHVFFSHAARVPALATDEALDNIMSNIVNHGVMGDYILPAYDTNGVIRTYGFYQYGFQYFYFGAGLKWLFGESAVVARAAHPILLGMVALVAFGLFRSASLAAGALFSILIGWAFMELQWPLVRPDAMVSLFAALGLAASAVAVRRDHPAAWFLAAFCWASAFTAHQIAATMIPGFILTWIVARMYWRTPASARFSALWHKSFFACAAGAALALFLYVWAIEFRIGDLARLWSDYMAYTNNPSSPGLFESVATRLNNHFQYSWHRVGMPMRGIIFAGLAAAFCFSVAGYLKKEGNGADIIALALPPLAATLSYQLGVGFYPNSFAGYAIVAHVTSLWTLCASVALGVSLIKKRLPSPGAWMEGGLLIAVLAATLAYSGNLLERRTLWMNMAEKFTPFSEYIFESIKDIPDRARVWGGRIFGVDKGRRFDLVEIDTAMFLVEDYKENFRSAKAPEYLVFDSLELSKSIAWYFQDPYVFDAPYAMFPRRSYELLSITWGSPYGATYTYAHKKPAAIKNHNVPHVSVHYDGSWKRGLEDIVDAGFVKGPPMRIGVRIKSRELKGVTDRSITADLAAGRYLIKVRRVNGHPSRPAMIVASPSSEFDVIVGALGLAKHSVAMAWPGQEDTYLLAHHGGGPIHIGLFDRNADAGLEVVSVQSVVAVRDDMASAERVALPELGQWHVAAKEGSLSRSDEADEWIFAGDSSRWGYQLQSGNVAVPENNIMHLTIPLKVESGNLAIGVLDRNGAWLVPPHDLEAIKFNTGDNGQIQIVIANNDNQDPQVKSAAALGNPELLYKPGYEPYALVLTACRDSRRKPPSECVTPEKRKPPISINYWTPDRSRTPEDNQRARSK